MKIIMFPRCHSFALLLLLALPAVVQAQFILTTNNNAFITITGYNGPGGAVVIPGATNGYTVTSIGDYAFEDCTNVTSVTIPSSVTSIGLGPFLGCASLTNISVNAGNPSYSSSANGVLFDKEQDTLIAYPEGLTNGTYAIPDSVIGIGAYAFASCSSLTNMFLSLINIGEFAFFECTGLTGVNVTRQLNSSASGAINIGPEAFMYCSSLTNLYLADTVTNIGDLAFAYCTSLTSVTIPLDATNIGELAFSFCTNLTSAYFETNAPPNDGTAFYGDPATVYYPLGTTGWGATFGGAPTEAETPASEFEYGTYDGSVTIIHYNGPGGAVAIPGTIDGYPVTSIGQQAFSVYDVTSVTIPNSVTSIGQFAFRSCDSLTNVTIPASVTSIGDYAFQDCGSLTSVTIANGATSIGAGMFSDCYSLTYITIPNSITNIEESAFQDCSSLTNIVIPGCVTGIGEWAFGYCDSLSSITIPSNVANIGGAAFGYCTSLTNISVAAANLAYSSTEGILFDKAFDTLVQYPAGLASSAYTIPNSVTNIGGWAFFGCTSLTSITIPASVTSIGVVAFSYCTSLTNITIPDNVTSIGDDAFGDCTSLTSITIPADVTSIGEFAFAYCGNLTSAYFLGNAPYAGLNAFSDPDIIVYYLPGTTGWEGTLATAPVVLWNPQASAVTTTGGQFGFNIAGPTNIIIVVEACTNLANPVWLPVSTNVLSGSGTSSFSDPHWTNYPNRYYRFSAP